MRHELSGPTNRALHELRTIQYLEETVGPAGLRRLADALADEEKRSLVQSLRRRAAGASLELESIIEDWSAAVSNTPRRPRRLEEGGLDIDEIIDTFIEVKQDTSDLLRRVAREAPTPVISERLMTLAQEEAAAVENLRMLAGRD